MRKLAIAATLLLCVLSPANAQGPAPKWATLFLARLVPEQSGIARLYAGREVIIAQYTLGMRRLKLAGDRGAGQPIAIAFLPRKAFRRSSPSPGSPPMATWYAASATGSLSCRREISSATGTPTSPARSPVGQPLSAATASASVQALDEQGHNTGVSMKFALALAIMVGLLTGCQSVPDPDYARYEKMQREVDAYYHCGEAKAWGMATTALRPRDIATGARNACKRVRGRMITKMQKCYPSPIWTKLTLDIEQTFKERAVSRVIDRREALGMPTVINWDL